MSDFTTKNAAILAEFVRMSNKAGARSDYVQGGGGNTSAKFDDSLMAIKASGFCLAQIKTDDAYAVLDYAAIRGFYAETDIASLADIEKEGAAVAKTATMTIEGLRQLRPSVEAGFHSVLDKFVLHIHPVYANMATCSVEGPAVVADALAGMGVAHAFVPYITPGTELTFTIRKACLDAEATTGKKPKIIFMQNHGLIFTGESADECLRLSDEVNARIAKVYGLSFADWPNPQIAAGASAGEFVSATPWLRERLTRGGWDLDFFCKQSLYPDQLVFLAGQLALGTQNDGAVKAVINPATGELFYRAGETDAKTIEETLCAVFFITDAIKRSGRTLCTMSESSKNFIANWEVEAYRQKMATASGR